MLNRVFTVVLVVFALLWAMTVLAVIANSYMLTSMERCARSFQAHPCLNGRCSDPQLGDLLWDAAEDDRASGSTIFVDHGFVGWGMDELIAGLCQQRGYVIRYR